MTYDKWYTIDNITQYKTLPTLAVRIATTNHWILEQKSRWLQAVPWFCLKTIPCLKSWFSNISMASFLAEQKYLSVYRSVSPCWSISSPCYQGGEGCWASLHVRLHRHTLGPLRWCGHLVIHIGGWSSIHDFFPGYDTTIVRIPIVC